MQRTEYTAKCENIYILVILKCVSAYAMEISIERALVFTCMVSPKAVNEKHKMKRITDEKSVKINENTVHFQENDVDFENICPQMMEQHPLVNRIEKKRNKKR